MKRLPIEMEDKVQDVLLKLSEGNPGAMSVLGMLLRRPDYTSNMLLLDLDDMNMRGAQIWVGFKDFAGSDIEVFAKGVKARDPDLVAKVNAEAMDGDPKAVTHGGSAR